MDNVGTRFALVIFLTLLTSACYMPSFLPVKADVRTIIVPNDYRTISSAIGNATNGDIIMIKNGVYTEQTLEINKSLTIMSENINGAQLSLHPPQIQENFFGQIIMVYTSPIKIDANNVKLAGLTIISDGGDIEANGNQIQVTNNIIGTQSTPLQLLVNGSGTQIVNNSIGTLSLTGSNQTVTRNHIGSTLRVSGDFNLITNNSAQTIGFLGSHNAVIQNSIVTVQSQGVGIELANGDYNMIYDNTLGNDMGAGIAVGYGGVIDYRGIGGGSNNIFAGNIVNGAHLWGILLGNGSYNVFYGNLIENSGGLGHDGFGLALGGTVTKAENNLFFYNAFVNNAHNFGGNWQVIGSNSFENGSKGNYWDDYLTKYPNATEINNSGIGDTPYSVYGNNFDN
jgi:parallel beta-helix repeat protein